jgi:hypothetical protein
MSAQNNNALIDRTLEFWQPRTRRDLKPEDARQMVENVSGFFRVLAEWDADARKADATRSQREPSGRRVEG